MHTFTLIHVILSLIGIVSGLVVIYGFLAGKRLRPWNSLFLAMTILTSVTGFFFPLFTGFKGFTPGIILGIVSLVILAVALLALSKGWTKTYIAMCSVADGTAKGSARGWYAHESTKRARRGTLSSSRVRQSASAWQG